MSGQELAAVIAGLIVAAVTKLGPQLIDVASSWIERLRPSSHDDDPEP